MKVSEICTHDAKWIDRDAPVEEAARRMRDEHVGDLVVAVEMDGRKAPVGMITDRDITLGVVATGAPFGPTARVGQVMSDLPLVTASENEEIEPVLKRMRSFGVRRVPVLDGRGGLTGVLAIDDVVVALSEALGELATLVSRQSRA